MPKSLKHLLETADQYADVFENYEPLPGDARDSPPPALALQLAVFHRAQAEKELAKAVSAAREAEMSWARIGDVIGTSGEAARQRYLHL